MKIKEELKKLAGSKETSLVLSLIVICAFVQIRNHDFLTAAIFESMFKNYAVTMLLALGMMCVLLIGGIDISVGSALGFSGMCSALIMEKNQDLPVLVIFLISIAIGAAVGLAMGCVVSYGKVPPIIATLGGLYVLRGFTFLVAGGRWVPANHIPKAYKMFAQGRYLGFGLVNNLVMLTFVVYVLFYIFFKWTRTGRKIYAIGSNPESAAVSGIRVNRIKLLCYTIVGCLCGLCGAIYTSLYASAQGNMGTGLEMDVIAACVVGGVSLKGGSGSVAGVFLGALTISIVGKALPLIGVSQFWQRAIKGFIIILAIIFRIIAQRIMDRNNKIEREV